MFNKKLFIKVNKLFFNSYFFKNYKKNFPIKVSLHKNSSIEAIFIEIISFSNNLYININNSSSPLFSKYYHKIDLE